MKWIVCLVLPAMLTLSGLAENTQETLLLLVEEHDNKMRNWQAQLDLAKTDRQRQSLATTRPETEKYAKLVFERVKPNMAKDWVVPYMAWLLRNHPKLTYVTKIEGKPDRIVDQELLMMRFFEQNHMDSYYAGEFILSLMFKVNPVNSTQMKKLALARKVFESYSSKKGINRHDKRVIGSAAFVCGMLIPRQEGNVKVEREILGFLTTAAHNAFDAQAGSLKVGDSLTEIFYVEKNLKIGRPALSFQGMDALNRRHRFSEYKGKAVLLIFWSQKMQDFSGFAEKVNRVVDRNKGKNFRVVGVTSDSLALVRNGIRDEVIGWRNVLDQNKAISKRYRVSAEPSCYIIDLNGTIVYRGGLGGPLYMEKLSAVLEGKVLKK